MRSTLQKGLQLTAIAAVLLGTGGCGAAPHQAARNQADAPRTLTPDGGTLRQQSASGTERAVIPLVNVEGKDYVIGPDFARQLDFNYVWDPGSKQFQWGTNDAAYVLTAGSRSAVRDDETLELPEAPLLHNSQFHIPASALTFLLADDVSYVMEGKTLVFNPIGNAPDDPIDGPDEPATGSELDFGDDPEDPFRGEAGGAEAEQPTLLPLDDLEAVPALKNIDMNGLASRARRYLGVKYLFGAGPYPKTGRFDCSTYSQYIFDKFSVKLNRTARSQAQQGTSISRKLLRKGDLLFFYVPGRFRSNNVVGHVGIYIGNGNMIHASPKPKNGVQITSIQKAYWKKTFLRARRVAY